MLVNVSALSNNYFFINLWNMEYICTLKMKANSDENEWV